MTENKPTRLARTEIHRSRWVSLYLDRVQFPGGRIIEQHHVLEFEMEAVAAIVENGAGEILLVEAYRYPVDALSWELPAGGIEAGETPEQAAAREVWEESGVRTTGHRLLSSYWPITGIGDKVFHVVHCRATSDTGAFDTNEIRSVRWASQATLRDWLTQPAIHDGYTLTGLLLYFSGLHRAANTNETNNE